MASTLKQIRDQIIIDANISGQPAFPTLRLNKMINLAQRYVQTNLNGLGMKKWETSDSLTLGASGSFGGGNVRKSNLSADCPNMLESPNSIIFIATTDTETSVSSLAYEIGIKEFQEQLLNTYESPTLYKPIFMRLTNQIYLAPDTIDTATAYYYKAITDLSADIDVTEIPIEFEEFVIKKVVMEIDSILGKTQDKELAQQQIDKDLALSYQKYAGKEMEKDRVKLTNNAKLQ